MLVLTMKCNIVAARKSRVLNVTEQLVKNQHSRNIFGVHSFVSWSEMSILLC